MTKNRINPIKNYLRNNKPVVDIDPNHKTQLWHQMNMQPAHKSQYPIYRYAAGTAVVLAVFSIYLLVNFNPVVGTAVWKDSFFTTRSVHSNTVYNTSNHTVEITLSDTSTIIAQPNTTLLITSNSSERSVEDCWIELSVGEIYASVTGNQSHNLYVRTPDVDVKVIGTKFRVSVVKR